MNRLALLLICVSACVAQPTQLGVIAGRLTGDDGTSIAGGHLSLQLVPPYPPGRLRQTEWSAVSGAEGAFRFEALPDGKYRLCTQVLNSAWLNPCEWGLRPPLVSLPGAQPIVSVTMALKKGAAVPIRIDDPGQFLSQNEGKAPGAHLLLGVDNDAFVFRPAPLTSQDANGRNHQIVVPFNSIVKLVVYSSFFRLSDSVGIPLPRAGVALPVTVPSGQQPVTITLRVTGGG
jgi:hypothetical protein